MEIRLGIGFGTKSRKQKRCYDTSFQLLISIMTFRKWELQDVVILQIRHTEIKILNVRNVSCFLFGGTENLTFIRYLSAADVVCVCISWSYL